MLFRGWLLSWFKALVFRDTWNWGNKCEWRFSFYSDLDSSFSDLSFAISALYWFTDCLYSVKITELLRSHHEQIDQHFLKTFSLKNDIILTQFMSHQMLPCTCSVYIYQCCFFLYIYQCCFFLRWYCTYTSLLPNSILSFCEVIISKSISNTFENCSGL